LTSVFESKADSPFDLVFLGGHETKAEFADAPSWADFITITPEHKFSVHTASLTAASQLRKTPP
jgi:hypothetical protein